MSINVTPSGTLYLCKVPLESDYKNQITFADYNAQLNYFQTTVKHTLTDYTYIKENETIVVYIPKDQIATCNYMYYVNTGFDFNGQSYAKTYFCFITKLEYVNENATRIYYQTDCFQTWLPNIVYNRCFVEREHTNDDSVGANTLPEGLETGEYICSNYYRYTEFTNLVYVLSCTLDGINQSSSDYKYGDSFGNVYNGIFGANTLYSISSDEYVPDTEYVQGALVRISKAGQADSITGLFLAPANLVSLSSKRDYFDFLGKVNGSSAPYEATADSSIQYDFQGYYPRNNKLLTYPYNYLLISNLQGQNAIYHYEDFSNPDQIQFLIEGVLCPGCSIRCSPMNYKGVNYNRDEGITLGKFPICSYPVDMYTNWLTQNSVNIGGINVSSDDINIGTSISNTAMGIVTSALTGEITGGLSASQQGYQQIMSSVIAKKQHSLMPVQARGNLNSGDVITAGKDNTFHFYKMTIKPEYARVIDDFFSMYGYLTNRVKVPNINGRQNWNYVKTINCNFDGDIPDEHLSVIRQMFDNGVTLWHNPNNIYRYDLSNNIV